MDSFTLYVTIALASFVMAMTMAMLYKASPRERSLLDWAAAGALIMISSVLAIMSYKTSMPYWLAPALGNTAYVLGHGAILAGVGRLLNRRAGWWLVILLAICIYLLQLTPPVRGSIGNRLLLLYPFVIAANLYVAILLLRAPSDELKPAFLPLAGVELFFAAQLSLRWGLVAFDRSLTLTPIGNEWLQTTGSLAVLVFLSAVTMGCALIAFRKQELALRQSALMDSLTQCFNRRALQDMAERQFKQCQRTGKHLTLILFDIDHFKSINDSHGHEVGDAALRHVAGVAASAMRTEDMLFRIGGEEFIVMLVDASPEDALHVAERVRQAVHQQSMHTARDPVSLSVSVGIATQHADDVRWDEIMNRADLAMYQSKHAGRNRVSVYQHHVAADEYGRAMAS